MYAERTEGAAHAGEPTIVCERVNYLDIDKRDLRAPVATAGLRGQNTVSLEFAQQNAVLALLHDLRSTQY